MNEWINIVSQSTCALMICTRRRIMSVCMSTLGALQKLSRRYWNEPAARLKSVAANWRLFTSSHICLTWRQKVSSHIYKILSLSLYRNDKNNDNNVFTHFTMKGWIATPPPTPLSHPAVDADLKGRESSSPSF